MTDSSASSAFAEKTSAKEPKMKPSNVGLSAAPRGKKYSWVC